MSASNGSGGGDGGGGDGAPRSAVKASAKGDGGGRKSVFAGMAEEMRMDSRGGTNLFMVGTPKRKPRAPGNGNGLFNPPRKNGLGKRYFRQRISGRFRSTG